MALPDLLRRLLVAPGPSGYEGPAAAVFREAAEGLGAEVSSDRMGSTLARVPGTGGEGALTVAVIGHIDEIGLIVTHVEDSGVLRFSDVGGWDPVVLVGQRVRVLTAGGEVRGVIARKPTHILSAEERKQAPELKGLHIDVGARDGDEARGLVRVGDVAVIDAEPLELPNGRVASRALDDRLGCWIALEAARLISERGDVAHDVVAVAGTQEELLPRMSGATAAAFALRPDVAIVVDVTWETGQPGVELGPTPAMEFGKGPVIERGPQLHPVVSDGLVAVAEAEGIDHVVSASGRGTFTDADAIYLVREGLPTGLVSVPIRHLHTPVEMAEIGDAEKAAELIAAWIGRLEPGTAWVR